MDVLVIVLMIDLLILSILNKYVLSFGICAAALLALLYRPNAHCDTLR